MATAKDLVHDTPSDEPQRLSEQRTVSPAVDIYENPDEILLVADLPGVAPDGMQLRLEEGVLELEGKQTPVDEQVDQSLPPMVFSRSFQVPDSIDPEGVSAELKQGVLRVQLRKSEKAKPRRIAVKAG